MVEKLKNAVRKAIVYADMAAAWPMRGSEMRRNRPVTMDEIAFCSTADDNFLPGCLLLLYSMKKHIPGVDAVPFYFFYDNALSRLSRESRDRISRIYPNARFVEKENELYRNTSCLTDEHKAAYLTLETFMVADHERVIFLDTDMLCVQNFMPKLLLPYDVIAVNSGDLLSYEGYVHWKKINSGLFSVSRHITGEATYNALQTVVRERTDKNPKFLDQNVINTYFAAAGQRLYVLPQGYNFRNWGAGGNGTDKQIRRYMKSCRLYLIHYSGYSLRPKPWEYDVRERRGLNGNPAYAVWDDYRREFEKEYGALQ